MNPRYPMPVIRKDLIERFLLHENDVTEIVKCFEELLALRTLDFWMTSRFALHQDDKVSTRFKCIIGKVFEDENGAFIVQKFKKRLISVYFPESKDLEDQRPRVYRYLYSVPFTQETWDEALKDSKFVEYLNLVGY